MPQIQTDPRVDAYIAAAAPFAQPILIHVRALVHRCGHDVIETIKWGMPFFVVDGRNLGNMAAFKSHASFGLWRGSELGLGKQGEQGGMGSFRKLISIADLPPEPTLLRHIQQAAALDAAGPRKRPPSVKKALPDPPPDLVSALAAVPAAQAVWDGFAPSCRRDYIEWVIEAKRPETRDRRIAQTVEQVAEGKDRNWKYRR